MDQEPVIPSVEGAPPKTTNWTLIIIIVVLVLLCLCCVFPLILYFWLGDIILNFIQDAIATYGHSVLVFAI